MRDLDDTDFQILQLLLSDARRPYSDIADVVGLSAPAVSDRVTRLKEVGVVRRFTVDVDRSQLRAGVPVLISLALHGGAATTDAVRETLLEADAVEHVFTTAAADLVVYARVPDTDVAGWLSTALDGASVDADTDDGTVPDAASAVDDVEVTLLSDVEWSPDLGGTEFALSCAECGNTVDSEGTASRIGGKLYQFCCSSCEARFEEQFERLQEGAD
jgi:Lrp/AsnC family leucine-responsive transcriptional regulator